MREVVLVFRKPYISAFSIDYLFNTLFLEIKAETRVVKYELPCFTRGIKSVITNIIFLTCFQDKVVHITGDTYYAILRALFCRRVVTIHDLSFLVRTQGIRRTFLKIFWITLPVHFSHKITVASQTTKDLLLEEVDVNPRKIKVIYNFIDPIYKPVIRNFNQHCPTILQVGADFNKNIGNLAKALAGINCTLLIIGRLCPEQKEALSVNRITYINKYSLTLQELHREYLIADILTFTSIIEGFGVPIIEGQATGLPVITSNCSSMPEVAGKGALLFDPLEPESIQQGISEMINNEEKRKNFVTAGYKNVKRFLKEKIANQYVKVYQDL